MKFLALLCLMVLTACSSVDDSERDPEDPAFGKLLFAQNCAACHGKDGRGNGPAAAALSKKPSNLRELAAQNGGVFDQEDVMSAIFASPSRKAGNMPAFGDGDLGLLIIVEHDGLGTPIPADLLALATYLESIQVP
ncbi:MAG: cytochrome c [Pseudomonadota bacterium]